MFLFIRNLAVSCILKTMSATVSSLLVATRATAQLSMTRTAKVSRGEVRYHAEFGKWEISSTLSEQGQSYCLLRRSATTLTTVQASKSTEITNTETDQRLPGV